MTGFAPFDKLLEFFDWWWVNWAILGLLVYRGSRIVDSGWRAVYYFCGIASFEVPAGIWPGIWPLIEVKKDLFCGDQIEESSKEPKEVVTKDGVTCKMEIRLLWRVKNLRWMVTQPYDADDQLLCKAESEFGGCGGWVSQHNYEECCTTKPVLEMIPETVKLADKWGVELAEVEVVTFAPANPEAQALASCLAMERQRSHAAKERVQTTKEIVTACPELNPNLVFAALSSMPISLVAPTDQLAAMRASFQSLEAKFPPPSSNPTEESVVVTGFEATLDQIPIIGPVASRMLKPVMASFGKDD